MQACRKDTSVGRYIAFEGGASRLLGQGADTLGRAARGDASAIGNLTEFVSGSVSGGTAALNVGRVGAATARTAIRTSAVVFQRSVQVVQKTVPVVTREIRSGMKSLGRGVIQGNGGRLNPLNYKVEGLGSNLGNLKYAGSRGGRSWNFVDEVTEDLIILESWEAIRAAIFAPKRARVDFVGSPDLYPVGPGQKNIVRIEYTGTRPRDFKAANQAAGIGNTQKPPKGFTWHHLDDYDPATNTGTMQLVKREVHEATYPHSGGVSQYEKAVGIPYDLNDVTRASIRAAGMALPGQ